MTRKLDNTCTVDGCGRPCWRGVCKGCARKIRNGTLPEQGGVKANPRCEVERCNTPTATTKVKLCRGHQAVQEQGRPLNSKRGKKRILEDPERCDEPGCEEDSTAKGKCRSHYSKERNPPLTKMCKAEECTVRTKNEMCKRHMAQNERYGFTWNEGYPKEKIHRWREERKPHCKIHRCDRKVSSEEATMCTRHRNDWVRKNCSEEFYEEIMRVEQCESCGSYGDLVTDHDHSCPHEKDRMCGGCIRGRLCNGCNTSLGLLGEDERRILALAEYINKHTR